MFITAALDRQAKTIFKTPSFGGLQLIPPSSNLSVNPAPKMSKDRFSFYALFLFFSLLLLSSCAYLAESGPLKKEIRKQNENYELIEVNSTADLPPKGRSYGQGSIPPRIKGESYSDKIRKRDVLRFIITDLSEQSPFFTRGDTFNYGPVEVPEEGRVGVPYVGDIQVIDQSLAEISAQLDAKLKPISSTAQGSVIRSGRISRTANVIGEVRRPGPVALERDGINSLDLLAASSGPNGLEHLYKYTLRRGERDYVFDYQAFRSKPFLVEEGDLLSVTQDIGNRFYVMGAILRPTIVQFPVPSPTLADALGAASGLDERRSDPSGIFVFRKGNPDKVYVINLKDPRSVLLTQRFSIKGEDIVYVTEAPLSRWARLLSQVNPLSQAAFNVDRIAKP
jgi:polysaccharide biosynthesis/export protein